METVDVIVIGAGAAGLMCAIEAGRRGRRVMVLDHANKAGKKILMSGGGRCNFTNRSVSYLDFQGASPHYCRSALSRFTPENFISRVEAANIAYHEKTAGQLFCDISSKEIVRMLLADCQAAGVTIHLTTTIDSIQPQAGGGYHIQSSRGRYCADSVVVATGGLSIPTMGASPFGYRLAEQFGLKVTPLRAGLVPFTLHEQDKTRLASLSGVSLPCKVGCGKTAIEESMLFTHRGLSGPACLQISSYWQPGEPLVFDLSPEVALLPLLRQAKQATPNRQVQTILASILPQRVVAAWLLEGESNQPLQSFTEAALTRIADRFHRWTIKPNNTEGYRTAEVTLGGVDVRALSSQTGEVKEHLGLYFIGEVVDVTGKLGGFNFQWAWASGYVAGQVV